MPPRRRKDDPLRDLDRDGDIDAGDNRIDDLNNDGRIDANDRDIRDLDGDNDIDATDRRLELERAQGTGQGQGQSQEQSHSSSADRSTEEGESVENELAPETPAPSVGEALGLKKNEEGTWQHSHSQSQNLAPSLRPR